jgi:hypothetical protein
MGGWLRKNTATFLGTCRSIWHWATVSLLEYMGVGTNLKFYIEYADQLIDITPLRLRVYSTTLNAAIDILDTTKLVSVNHTAHGALAGDIVTISGAAGVGNIPAGDLNARHTITTVTSADKYVITVATTAASTVTGGGGAAIAVSYVIQTYLLGSAPFATVSGSPIVTVSHTAHGAISGDFVTFSGATAVAAVTPLGEYVLTYVDANSYTITAASNANATTTGGGTAVRVTYQIATGSDTAIPLHGWGAGYYGSHTWSDAFGMTTMRLWTQANYGDDLVFGPRGGALYYWDATNGTSVRGIALATMDGADYVPLVQNLIMVSDVSRFVFVFGCNEIGSSTLDPMLIRWSDQENVVEWNPLITNLAGSLRLSCGTYIVTAIQVRQEILVWTDAALYSVQFLGAPLVWGATIMGNNISCTSPRGAVVASGVAYWMGRGKFYKYDGRVDTLNCDLRKYIFDDLNKEQAFQFFAGTIEAFNEVWWFYCSGSSTTIDKYVVFNYLENVWYYGNCARTAWISTGLCKYPMGATYSHNIVEHEIGCDDGTAGVDALVAIDAYILSSQFDIGEGHQFSFINKMLPDVSFEGSDADNPAVIMTLYPLAASGSGYTTPASVAAAANATVTRTATLPIEKFTDMVYPRVRGRQMSLKIESTALGVAWQGGTIRLDTRLDGRRG